MTSDSDPTFLPQSAGVGDQLSATAKLVRAMGGELVGQSFLIELGFLRGREKLHGPNVHAVLEF